LGLRFLRHIERNSILLFMIPADTNDLKKEYKILLKELKLHNPELLDKKRVIAISKCDMLDDELLKELKKLAPKDKMNDDEKVPVVFISSVAMKGIDELKDVLWRMLN
jgi:GTP-binding protein